MRKVQLFLICVTVILGFVCITAYASDSMPDLSEMTESELRRYANQNNICVVFYQQSKRETAYTQCDATQEYFYFAYTKYNCVDVYGAEGEFLYSFLLPDSQNGGISVRCHNDVVYICDKRHGVHVFKGLDEIACLPRELAEQKGYDSHWFHKHEPCIVVNGEWITQYDSNGTVIRQVPTPFYVKQTIPLSVEHTKILFVLGAAAILLLLLKYYFTFRKEGSK